VHLGWIHALATVNHATVNTGVPVSLCIQTSIRLDIYTELRELCHTVDIFSLLRSLQTVLHNGYSNMHPHQQCTAVPFPPHHHPYLFVCLFKVIARLNGMGWYLTLVLIYMSLMPNDTKFFPYICWLSVFLLRSIYSGHFHIFLN
jgi:hypothetical protein